MKSFFDSIGLRLKHLEAEYDFCKGRYKLFTSTKYRDIVFSRLHKDLQDNGMMDADCQIRLGLAVGKVYGKNSELMREYIKTRDWFFWPPEDIKEKVTQLASQRYSNDPSIITAKILMR